MIVQIHTTSAVTSCVAVPAATKSVEKKEGRWISLLDGPLQLQGHASHWLRLSDEAKKVLIQSPNGRAQPVASIAFGFISSSKEVPVNVKR